MSTRYIERTDKTQMLLRYAAAMLVGYLVGAMPIGYLIGKLRGVNVLQHGSGRTGGTNVMRAAGPVAAALTVLGDGLKGLLAVTIAAFLIGTPEAKALTGLAAIIGHNWSVFLSWRGGAGAVTNMGVIFGLYYPLTIGLVVVGFIALVVSRMASAATLALVATAFVSFVVLAILGYVPWAYAIYGLTAGIVIAIALLPNIRRILAGTERHLTLNH